MRLRLESLNFLGQTQSLLVTDGTSFWFFDGRALDSGRLSEELLSRRLGVDLGPEEAVAVLEQWERELVRGSREGGDEGRIAPARRNRALLIAAAACAVAGPANVSADRSTTPTSTTKAARHAILHPPEQACRTRRRGARRTQATQAGAAGEAARRAFSGRRLVRAAAPARESVGALALSGRWARADVGARDRAENRLRGCESEAYARLTFRNAQNIVFQKLTRRCRELTVLFVLDVVAAGEYGYTLDFPLVQSGDHFLDVHVP